MDGLDALVRPPSHLSMTSVMKVTPGDNHWCYFHKVAWLLPDQIARWSWEAAVIFFSKRDVINGPSSTDSVRCRFPVVIVLNQPIGRQGEKPVGDTGTLARIAAPSTGTRYIKHRTKPRRF